MKEQNNKAILIGTAITNYEFSHSAYNEDFYLVNVSSLRHSGVDDILPVMVSKKIINIKENCIGKKLEVEGSYRTRNYYGADEKKHLLLYLFADVIRETDQEDYNYIYLSGQICKKPNYRETPHGRQITDFLLAVNRTQYRSDYIPIIAWGRNAIYISSLHVGTPLTIEGRMQSREYTKTVGDGCEIKITYEASVTKIIEEQDAEPT